MGPRFLKEIKSYGDTRHVFIPCLTFTEDKIRSDVKGLDADFRQQELHRLLVITGDEGDCLLCLAFIGLPRWGDQGREPMGAGCVLPSCQRAERAKVKPCLWRNQCDFIITKLIH